MLGIQYRVVAQGLVFLLRYPTFITMVVLIKEAAELTI